MRDFNTVKEDLIRHLNLSCQKTDGEILFDYYQASGETKKDCPLIPVPEHGRLIDVDALPTNRVE